jgi:4-amino-4-deoxy-L-arabinose transferase-like glycosyltransferase
MLPKQDKSGDGQKMATAKTGFYTALLLTVLLWSFQAIWLSRDSRPPVWDMALHQTYALNYVESEYAINAETAKPWERSGNYPPFVHWMIAAAFLLFHPASHIAVIANIPATFILFWAVYELAKELADASAGFWACVFFALIPYLSWISRETILDYWLSAWFAAALIALRRTQGFQSRHWSLLLACIMALGLLTKWFFIGFMLAPLGYIIYRFRIWQHAARLLNLADALIISGLIAGLWYLPNLPQLVRYFGENAKVGAMEGEPPILSFQSFIYYLRLLEGYQLFGLLFVLLCIACVVVWKKKLLDDWRFLALSIAGGWLVLTLLRTKDPRFTMPLLGPLSIITGVWVASWKKSILNRSAQVALVMLLGFQIYLANFGVNSLPKRAVILEGYQGSFRWDWNLFLQDYLDVFGRPKREDWKQDAVLVKLSEDAQRRNVQPSLGLVPDLPWFNESNFALYARFHRMRLHVSHLKSTPNGVQSFDGYNYVLMTEQDQGMSWTTVNSRALNQIIVDNPKIFLLVEVYKLPNGDGARLYYILREPPPQQP